MIGNGWLRESPRAATPMKWDVRGRSALRKCMFMAVPDEIRRMMPADRPAERPVMAAYAPPREHGADIVPHRRNPAKDAREFPAFGGGVDPRQAAAEAQALEARRAQKAAVADAARGPLAWWEDPVALGSLLILVPPIGLAAVWSSKRYSSDARWALTVMTALTMCLVSAVLIAALAMN